MSELQAHIVTLISTVASLVVGLGVVNGEIAQLCVTIGGLIVTCVFSIVAAVDRRSQAIRAAAGK